MPVGWLLSQVAGSSPSGKPSGSGSSRVTKITGVWPPLSDTFQFCFSDFHESLWRENNNWWDQSNFERALPPPPYKNRATLFSGLSAVCCINTHFQNLIFHLLANPTVLILCVITGAANLCNCASWCHCRPTWSALKYEIIVNITICNSLGHHI